MWLIVWTKSRFVSHVCVADMGEGGSDSTGVSARVLSSMLNEMDGIQGKHHVLVVACTNRPDLIDAALLRPGTLGILHDPPS